MHVNSGIVSKACAVAFMVLPWREFIINDGQKVMVGEFAARRAEDFYFVATSQSGRAAGFGGIAFIVFVRSVGI